MKQARALITFLGRIEGLPIAAVLAVLYLVFLATAPTVFSRYPIYRSFLETVPPVLLRIKRMPSPSADTELPRTRSTRYDQPSGTT